MKNWKEKQIKIVKSMPTFAWLYQIVSRHLAAIRQPPYVAFLLVSIIATTIVPFILNLMWTLPGSRLSEIFIVSIPICLPVLSGDLAIYYFSRKHPLLRPSLLLRFLILALVMEGFFLIIRYRNPQEVPEYAVMEEVIFMSLYGAQCVLLLIIEPGLRWLLRRRVDPTAIQCENPETHHTS